MKKLITTSALMVLILSGSWAQAPSQTLHFGLKLAPILSWSDTNIEGQEDDGSSIGFIYGLMTDFRFTENYAFSTGIELSQRKGKTKHNTLDYSTKFDFQYIDLPVALKLSTNEIGYMKYFGKFGFIPGFNVKATYDIDSNEPAVPSVKDKKFSSEVNIFNVGLIIGVGAEYNISGKTSLMVELLYNNGFIDILKENNTQLKTDYIALNLGVYF